MNDLWVTVLSLSVSGTLLILILLLLRPLYRNRLSKRWQYYIWLIVIARLLIPLAPEVNLVGSCFAMVDARIVRPVTDAYFGTEDLETENGALPDGQREDDLTAPGAMTAEEAGTAAEEAEAAAETGEEATQAESSIGYAIGVLWIAVAAALLIRKITVYQSFVKYVRAGCEEVSDIERLEEFGKIVEEQRIRACVELYTNSLISSPLLMGFWKPCIVLPTANMPAADFRFTVLHELSHYKRGDMFYKWLGQMAVCLHWFNPFVYVLVREINRSCELSCDEEVVSKLSAREKRAYGNTLLNAVKTGGSYRNSAASVTLCESGKILGERLGSIMSYKKPSIKNICVSIALVAVLLCAAFFAGSYSMQNREPAQAKDSAQAKDGTLTTTARADNVAQTDHPNIDITLDDNAAIKLLPTADDAMTADYDDTLYQVKLSGGNGNYKLHISYIGSASKYPPVLLHLPDIPYGNVDIRMENATANFKSVFRSADAVSLDLEGSSVFYTIPAGFKGKINADAPDCYLELYSDSGYTDCGIRILNLYSDAADYDEHPSNYGSLGVLENSFTRQNGELTYSNGTKAGCIDVDFQKSGYLVVK